VNTHILPVAGAIKGTRRPKTSMTFDGEILTVTDAATGNSASLSPASLYHYRYSPDGSGRKSHTLRGVAMLDPDGLVLIDLPGHWRLSRLREFAEEAGIPLVDGRNDSMGRASRILAARAPGWQRLRGLPAPPLARWSRPLSVGAGIAGLGAMVYLGAIGLWGAWRDIANVGRFVLEFIEAKWLVVAFSPALLITRPAVLRIHRWRVKRGLTAGPLGGPYLRMKTASTLCVYRRTGFITELTVSRAHTFLLYRYDGLSGLFVLAPAGIPLAHMPGRWSPEDLHRFTQRHGLGLAVHRLSREEYVDLAKRSKQAIP
jgi:hypothetical protein